MRIAVCDDEECYLERVLSIAEQYKEGRKEKRSFLKAFLIQRIC